MTKRKKRKNSKEKTPGYLIELYGIALVLIAILGIGKYGPVGKVISSFSVFLVGSLYFFLLAFVLIIGIYIMIKREKPELFNSKMIGIYLIIIGILVIVHKNFVLEGVTVTNIIGTTFDNIMTGINKIMEGTITVGVWDQALSNTGGGIFGSLFASLFYKLFEAEGTNIVVWVFIGAGVMVFTGFSIFDIVKRLGSKAKDIILEHDEDEEEIHKRSKEIKDSPIMASEKESRFKINDNNVDEDEEPKKVVKNLSELTLKTDKEEKQQAPKEVVPINENYQLPSLDILDAPSKNKKTTDKASIQANSKKLVETLLDFGIHGAVVAVNIGPSVIQYELELLQGTKLSRLVSINKEIALALAKKDVRIQAPIPGKSTVGIEMPNDNAQTVTLRETLEGIVKQGKLKSKLSVGLGKDIMGNVQACYIDKTPHMLVAGATGSGKSVCINGIIVSLLMFTKPSEVKLILVDPKKVELGVYNGVPHLVIPVVTDPKKASMALQKAVVEMDKRYDLFEETKTRNITSYNEYVDKINKDIKEEDQIYHKLPYWVVIVDELADLMLVAGKEVESSIMRITQMARAAGIHLIIATQRPSTDVITGLIKANIPSRLSFAVSSQIDSRTILDMGGAEKLLGKGDMLYLPMGDIVPQRIQGAFVKDDEIERVVNWTVAQQKAQYDQTFFQSADDVDQELKSNTISNDEEEYEDPLYNEIVEFVITTGKASASLLQRKFRLGYNRAARCIDLLEERGIIGPQNGSKPREVLVKLEGGASNEEE